MLNPCARESKVPTGRFLRQKLISDYGLFFSYEGRQGAANGQDSWGVFRDARGFGRLDAGSCAGLPDQGLHHHRPQYFDFPYFCTMCGLEEPGLVDQN